MANLRLWQLLGWPSLHLNRMIEDLDRETTTRLAIDK